MDDAAAITKRKGPAGETVGRTVDYVLGPEDAHVGTPGRVVAAIVVAAGGDELVLELHPPPEYPDGHTEVLRPIFRFRPPFAETLTPGHWSWPTRI